MSEEAKPTQISKQAFEQLMIVRDGGQVNMFDFNGVKRIASESDLPNLIWFLNRCTKGEYSRLIFGQKEEVEASTEEKDFALAYMGPDDDDSDDSDEFDEFDDWDDDDWEGVGLDD